MDDVAGIGKALEAFEKLTREAREIAAALLRPAAQEAGAWLGDRVRLARAKTMEAMLLRYQRIMIDAGRDPLHPEPVPLKILVPVIEDSSFDDDEALSAKWAGLLASAATGAEVHPSYASVLSQLTGDEARILDCVYKREHELRSQGLSPSMRTLDDGPYNRDEVAEMLGDLRGPDPVLRR
jgi:hypothetical protein